MLWRARLAMDILEQRCGAGLALRFDLIGLSSVFGDDGNRWLQAQAAAPTDLQDIRLRVAARHEDAEPVDRLLREVTALWTCGPAGGGGVRTHKRQRLAMQACLVPRSSVPAQYEFIA